MSALDGLRRIPGAVRAVSAVGLGVATIAVVTAVATGANPAHTKGPIPDAAFRPGQPLDLSLVPDFVPALDRNGKMAGYVRKEALAEPASAIDAGRQSSPQVPVFGNDLATIVGYMVPDKGFVPLGTNADTVPNIPASAAPIP
jgi:hypothetical protein